MASSSSAKKVARVAAKSGSGSGPSAGKAAKQRNWLFGVAIVAIVGLGVGAVAFARAENEGLGKNDTPPRARVVEGEPFDHWHASFALEVCGKELPAVVDDQADVQGIHTHGDGLIHIHPFTTRAAGKRATMARFFKQIGLTVTDDGFKTSDGTVYKEGETSCPEGKDTQLVLAHWKSATAAPTTKPDQVYTEDFADVAFTEDLGAYTLALIVKGEDDQIQAPSASAEISTLGLCDGANPPPECETPGESLPPDLTVPTAPAEDTTTTAPAEDTTTTEAPG